MLALASPDDLHRQLILAIFGVLLVATLELVPPLLLTRFFQAWMREAKRAHRRQGGRRHRNLQETLRGVDVIRALG